MKMKEKVEAREANANLQHEVLDEFRPFKDGKLARLQDISECLQELDRDGSRATITPVIKYSKLPDVKVCCLVKGVRAVDTSEMSFEANCMIYLDWDDPV